MKIIAVLAVIAVIAAIAVLIWRVEQTGTWDKIKTWFKDSETIFYARLQVLGGILLAIVPTLNPVSWLDSALTPAQRWTAAGFAVINGLVTEWLRRRRADL